ncbi:hypothetical protein CA51_12420 [Rosistilla oblonga]|uniref:SlyX family protein n=1 Tax=Rosistilla oblonga TaxID=2527990 RepID=UPI001189B27A|nr:SlyX family protein [Rosistilla oblonga]QDV11380.1 hypothetical protein CA51_12420 [Rosistilla oblonga]
MNPSESMQQQINKLQETVAFQQRTIDHFHEALLEIRRELDNATRQLDQQKGRVHWLSENIAGDNLPHEKPPHY